MSREHPALNDEKYVRPAKAAGLYVPLNYSPSSPPVERLKIAGNEGDIRALSRVWNKGCSADSRACAGACPGEKDNFRLGSTSSLMHKGAGKGETTGLARVAERGRWRRRQRRRQRRRRVQAPGTGVLTSGGHVCIIYSTAIMESLWK